MNKRQNMGSLNSISSLISLCLSAILLVNFNVQAQQTDFFQSMKLGEYKCNPNLCEIKDKKAISLDERINYKYTMFILPYITGFVENITPQSDHIYDVNVNWDDGSGKSNREIIHVQSLGASSFLITDSHGQRNLMDLVSNN